MEENKFLNNLSDEWNDIEEIIVFGFGRTAVRNIDKLSKDFRIRMIIDNDSQLHGKKYGNIMVQSFEEAKNKLESDKIVVATSSVAYAEISALLRTIGKEEHTDFCRLKDFMAEWYWKNRRQVCLSQTFSSVTSKCTFNCKHCNMFMPKFKCEGGYDYDENDILADFDHYFKVVDYVASWSILGGEPLLNRRLSKIIEVVYQKYKNKIGYIQVISNASIVPNEQLIQTMQKCKVRMRLSDYTHVINYQERLEQVKECLEKNNIPYDMSVYEQWYDIGERTEIIPEFVNNEDKIIKHMRLCATGCHQLNDKRFYFCGQGFAKSKKGMCTLREGDFIELQKCTGSIEDKEMMLKYCMGYPPKGYISICSTCYGMGPDNNRVVAVGEQI